MGKSAEIPDLVWGETKSIPCITLQIPQAKTLAPTEKVVSSQQCREHGSLLRKNEMILNIAKKTY